MGQSRERETKCAAMFVVHQADCSCASVRLCPAVNKDELKYLGVKHIMNCASEDVDNMFPEEFEYTAFPISDDHEGEPNAYFDQSYEVIAKIKADRSLVFVHWSAGPPAEAVERVCEVVRIR